MSARDEMRERLLDTRAEGGLCDGSDSECVGAEYCEPAVLTFAAHEVERATGEVKSKLEEEKRENADLLRIIHNVHVGCLSENDLYEMREISLRFAGGLDRKGEPLIADDPGKDKAER